MLSWNPWVGFNVMFSYRHPRGGLGPWGPVYSSTCTADMRLSAQPDKWLWPEVKARFGGHGSLAHIFRVVFLIGCCPHPECWCLHTSLVLFWLHFSMFLHDVVASLRAGWNWVHFIRLWRAGVRLGVGHMGGGYREKESATCTKKQWPKWCLELMLRLSHL